MDIKVILIEAIIWSVLWMIMVSISVRAFPFTIEHDYPKDVRKAANISIPSKKHRMQGLAFATVGFIFLFGLLIAFAISAYIRTGVILLENIYSLVDYMHNLEYNRFSNC